MKARRPPPLPLPRASLVSTATTFLLLNAACGIGEERGGLPVAAQSPTDGRSLLARSVVNSNALK